MVISSKKLLITSKPEVQALINSFTGLAITLSNNGLSFKTWSPRLFKLQERLRLVSQEIWKETFTQTHSFSAKRSISWELKSQESLIQQLSFPRVSIELLKTTTAKLKTILLMKDPSRFLLHMKWRTLRTGSTTLRTSWWQTVWLIWTQKT